MRTDTPTWDAYLAGFATHAATKSRDSTQVGAVLVADDGRSVLLTGYNGPPAGVADLPERFERPTKYLFAAHAEANVIATAARRGIHTDGCVLYVTHHPCSACSRLIIQAGIKRVYFGEGTTSMPAAEFEAARVMFEEAGVVALATRPSTPSQAVSQAEAPAHPTA
jgi:dCMP deaminase